MITTVVGKTFLKKYNKEMKTTLTAKEFVSSVFFNYFFNHQKYFIWQTNSPFVQGVTKSKKLTTEELQRKLDDLHEKVEKISPDASFAIGFPAAEEKEYATTSGLVTDIVLDVSKEDIYYSWIGVGLGIGVAGGYCLLIDDEEILWKMYQGWEVYRSLLNDDALSSMRGNQINTWNGQWLTYVLGKDFDPNFDFNTLVSYGIIKSTDKLIEVNTVNWSNLFFSLSRLYPNRVLNAYVYSFGQMNKTIGFIPLYLNSAKRLIDTFKALFPYTENQYKAHEFQSLFGIHIKRACEMGAIGMRALRPDSLKKYLNKDENLKFKKEGDLLNYRIYKTWLIAMISSNKKETVEYTEQIAKLLLEYRKEAKKNDRTNLINERLLNNSSKKEFILALADMLPDLTVEQSIILKELRNKVHLMTNEEFGYFRTLLKFDYAFIEKQN